MKKEIGTFTVLGVLTWASVIFAGPMGALTGCAPKGFELGGKIGLYPVDTHTETTTGSKSFLSDETWAWLDGTWKSAKAAVGVPVLDDK